MTNEVKLNKSTIYMWWFPVAVGFFVLVSILAVILPQTQSLIENNRKLNQEKQVLIKAEKKLNQVEELNQEDLESKMTLALAALPDHKPYYEVLSTLQTLAKNSQVQLGSFDLNPGSLSTPSAKANDKKQNENLVYLQTEITAKGNLEQVTSFIDSVQKSLPLITVKSITITESDDKTITLGILIVMSHAPEMAKSNNQVSFEPLAVLATNIDETMTLLEDYQAMVGNDQPSQINNIEREDVFSF